MNKSTASSSLDEYSKTKPATSIKNDSTSDERLHRIEQQEYEIQHLSAQLLSERENAKRFALITELQKELDDPLDIPVAAQFVVSTIQNHFETNIVAVLSYEIETQELCLLAAAGKNNFSIPAEYRQSIDVGIMGRTVRLRRTQVVYDTRNDEDYVGVQGIKSLSEITIPLIHHGHLKGVLIVDFEEANAFSVGDVQTLEKVAEELINTWERVGYNHRLKTLIESSVSLSTSPNPQLAIEEVSLIARETLDARFVFVALFDQDGSFTRTSSSGNAPSLEKFLGRDLRRNSLLKAAIGAKKTFRVRDIRKYKDAASITLEHSMLRGLMLIPIRLHGVNIGAILAFGKEGGVFFSQKDEALANLLAAQAVAAIESAWLIQELRSKSAITSALHQLSFGILQIDEIKEAAELIAETAYRLARASVSGIVLFSLEKEIQTALEVSEKGVNFSKSIPLELIEQTLSTGESITLSSGEKTAHIYLPIQTSLRKYGVLWVEFSESERQASSQAQTLLTLANQAAMALERVMLLLDTRQKAREIKDAYLKLENAYDQTLSALMSALDARDKETEGHSIRVGKMSCLLGKELNLNETQLKSLQRGSLLHDIGKIGIVDAILNKEDKLTEEEWGKMREHPAIGRKIVKRIPFLEDAITVVYGHHERWDGSGYPQGLSGENIPLEARIFAVADIFDALTSVRPYREKATEVEALAYLKEQAGILLDPDVVTAFERLLKAGYIQSAATPVK